MNYLLAAIGLVLLVRLLVSFGYWYGDRHRPVPPVPPATTDPEPIGVLCEQPLVHELPSPCPGRFRWARVAGKEALPAIPALDRMGREQGWCAILAGDAGSLPQFNDVPDEDPAGILRLADTIDVGAWHQRRLDDLLADGTLDPRLLGKRISATQARKVLPEPYAVLRDGVLGRPHDSIYIALVPVEHAWMAPAYLQNGGWNEVPEPAEQVAVLCDWDRRFGARLRSFSHDTMEFDVTRPPDGNDASLALAREHMGFCSDVVFQGTTLLALASALEAAPNWYFWWD